jgi:hypothetical protein
MRTLGEQKNLDNWDPKPCYGGFQQLVGLFDDSVEIRRFPIVKEPNTMIGYATLPGTALWAFPSPSCESPAKI